MSLTLLLSIGLFAQSSPRLNMQSGIYELNADETQNALNPIGSEGMTMIRVVQFTRPLLQEEQEYFRANTGEVLGYLPTNAYLVELPVGISTDDFKSLPLHAVAPLSAEMKMTVQIYNANIPEYAWKGDRIFEAVVGFSPNSNVAQIAAEMEFDGWEVVRYNQSNHTITTIISLDDRVALASLPQVIFLQQGEDPGEKENLAANRNSRSSAIKNVFPNGRTYDGSGVVVGHGDDGDIGPHIDFTGRIIARNTTASTGDHGDHVAGTIFGAGNLDQTAEGMAPGADLVYYSYPRNLNFVDQDYVNYSVRVTNSSYSNGCNAGYTNFARQMDIDAFDNPLLVHVFSAGNNGTSDCGYGAGSGWGNVTGGHKIGKNVIATANVQYNDQIASSSSRGPAADGRIKPDIAAVGTDVYSTLPNNGYGLKTGTSMACPGAAGSMAQLIDAYKDVNGTEPLTGLMKAIMLNSADDLGTPGPDFIYGFGRINNYRAVQVIENAEYQTGTVTQGETDTVNVSIPNHVSNVRIMVYWTDPAALVSPAITLVNNIDAYAKDESGQIFYPLIPDHTPNAAALNTPATQGIDSINNVEQLVLGTAGVNGTIKVVVQGTNIPSGPQDYFVVLSYDSKEEITYPFGGESLIAGSSDYLMFNNSGSNNNYAFEYSVNNGSSWTPISTSATMRGGFAWTVPNITSDNVMIRMMETTTNTYLDTTDYPVVIAPRPTLLNLESACPSGFTVKWNPVAGAAEYMVYALGQKYMDTVGRTVDTFFTFTGYNPNQEVWWSVAAIPSVGGQPGPRALAKMKPTGVQNCLLNRDLSSTELVSPQAGEIPDCQDLSNMPIVLDITNFGITQLDTLPFAISVNGNVTRDTVFSSLLSGYTLQHTFATTINANTQGSYTVRVWGELNADDNPYNDTIDITFDVVAGNISSTLPFVESFDNWTICSNATDCEATVCTLPNGWDNLDNGVQDDIDWRTFSGSTSSSGTGPNNDHTQGNSSGKYLYIEASGPCVFKEAVLMTPCIDLTGATLPEFSFWYHMFGPDINELHVDMLVDGEWMLDIINPISGNQGNSWQQRSFGLLPYVGKTVNFRFRGSTGADYQGDIAIDDISVTNSTAAPVADLFISDANPCLNSTVFLEDRSTNVPDTWNWSITPATHTYVNGTSSASQNPEVEFTALGTYTVTLTASNANGSDVVVDSSIVVGNGSTLPYQEDFENGFVPLGWSITNLDQLNTWESQTCYGPNGNVTVATRVDNYGYNAAGQLDILEGVNIDLASTTAPTLVFDVAYSGAPGNRSDRLKVEVSSDCGATWNATGYDMTGSALATTPAVNRTYIPAGAAQWRRDSIDLSTFAGMSLKVRFVNVTGGGNGIYLDNVQMYDVSVTPPADTLYSDLQDSCISKTFTFTYPGANATNVTWNFGSGASPATATGVGPHNVNYSFSGSKLVSMTASNAGGQVSVDQVFNLFVKPTANFSHVVDPQDSLNILFFDASTGQVDSYFWDFNDQGATSNLEDPTHQFSQGGDFEITLVVDNRCGPDTITRFIYGVTLPEDAPQNWVLAPNPASNQLVLFATDGELNVNSASIYSLSGKQLYHVDNTSGANQMSFDVSTYPAGVYMMQIATDTGITNVKFLVQH